MTNALIMEEAAEWLITLREDPQDELARAQFAAWLRKSPEHVRAYLELTSVWADAADIDRKSAPDASALIARARADNGVIALQDLLPQAMREAPAPPAQMGERKVPNRFERMRHGGLVAAALVLAILTGSLAWWQTQRFATYETGIGEQRSIALADGSMVELNSRSRMRVRYADNERVIDLLEGQGLFKVAKDRERPFIVRSGDVNVRAVGTQFDVYRKAQGTLVTVLEGRVEVSATSSAGESVLSSPRAGDASAGSSYPSGQASNRGEAVQLIAGQQVIAAHAGITQPTTANVATAAAWTQRQLVFDSVPLREVAQEFNRYNHRQLVISDALLEDMLISGVFSSTDPASLLRFLREQPDLSIIETDAEIRLSARE